MPYLALRVLPNLRLAIVGEYENAAQAVDGVRNARKNADSLSAALIVLGHRDANGVAHVGL